MLVRRNIFFSIEKMFLHAEHCASLGQKNIWPLLEGGRVRGSACHSLGQGPYNPLINSIHKPNHIHIKYFARLNPWNISSVDVTSFISLIQGNIITPKFMELFVQSSPVGLDWKTLEIRLYLSEKLASLAIWGTNEDPLKALVPSQHCRIEEFKGSH